MEKQFVNYEIAKALMAKGFNEPCLAFYDVQGVLVLGQKPEYLLSNEKANYIFSNEKIYAVSTAVVLAPLWQQLIEWFKDKYNIHIHPNFYTNRIDASRSYEYLVHHKVDGIWRFISISGMNPREIAIYEALKKI